MSETKTDANPFIPLTFRAYEQKAMSYRLPTADLEYALLNLAGEVGELLSLYAKKRRDGVKEGEPMNVFKRNVKKEIGDVLWCLTAIADDVDERCHLEEVGLINLVKLRDRAEAGTIQGSGDDR